MARRLLAAAILTALTTPLLALQPGVEFEVASIRRNTGGAIQVGPPVLPNGEVRFVNIPARTLILRAYPVETIPAEVVGLPSWVDSARYDVVAKGKPGATVEEQLQMWRALLAERMKLAAHYEMRDRPVYNLQIARQDGTVGSGLTPSALDCSQPLPPPGPRPPGVDMRTLGMERCRSFATDRDGTMYAGGVELADLARMISPAAGRVVVDRTGLTGFFAVTMRYQQFPLRADARPSADDPPSLFTALREQLGLKLESGRADLQILVVDRVEPPSEN